MGINGVHHDLLCRRRGHYISTDNTLDIMSTNTKVDSAAAEYITRLRVYANKVVSTIESLPDDQLPSDPVKRKKLLSDKNYLKELIP